jgi:hypothetical protein
VSLSRTLASICPGSRSYASVTRNAGVPPWSWVAESNSGFHYVKP